MKPIKCMQLYLLAIMNLMSILDECEATNKCYRAKICIHDGKEKCGEDGKDKVRRFLDTCDMKEYNCLKNANYVKTSLSKCEELPPIGNNFTADKNEKHEDKNFLNEPTIDDEMSDNSIVSVEADKVDASEKVGTATKFIQTYKKDEVDRGSEENHEDFGYVLNNSNETDKVLSVESKVQDTTAEHEIEGASEEKKCNKSNKSDLTDKATIHSEEGSDNSKNDSKSDDNQVGDTSKEGRQDGALK